MWKTNSVSQSPCLDAPGISQNYQSPEVLEGIEGSVSARKLVSVLWQLNNNDIKDRDFSELSHNSISDVSCNSQFCVYFFKFMSNLNI